MDGATSQDARIDAQQSRLMEVMTADDVLTTILEDLREDQEIPIEEIWEFLGPDTDLDIQESQATPVNRALDLPEREARRSELQRQERQVILNNRILDAPAPESEDRSFRQVIYEVQVQGGRRPQGRTYILETTPPVTTARNILLQAVGKQEAIADWAQFAYMDAVMASPNIAYLLLRQGSMCIPQHAVVELRIQLHHGRYCTVRQLLNSPQEFQDEVRKSQGRLRVLMEINSPQMPCLTPERMIPFLQGQFNPRSTMQAETRLRTAMVTASPQLYVV